MGQLGSNGLEETIIRLCSKCLSSIVNALAWVDVLTVGKLQVCITLFWLGRTVAELDEYDGPQLDLELFKKLMAGKVR